MRWCGKLDSRLSYSPQARRAVFDAQATEIFCGVQGQSGVGGSAGELTLTELASKYDVHPTMIAGWKRQGKEGMVASFSGKAASVKKDSEAEIRELHAKIGQLTVEKDFLERAFAKR